MLWEGETEEMKGGREEEGDYRKGEGEVINEGLREDVIAGEGHEIRQGRDEIKDSK